MADRAALERQVQQAFSSKLIDAAQRDNLLKLVAIGVFKTPEELNKYVATMATNNASGESAASLEAISRDRSWEFAIVTQDKDGRWRLVRKVPGVDAVDFDPKYLKRGEYFVTRNRGTGKITVLARK